MSYDIHLKNKTKNSEEKIKIIREIWNRMPNQMIILDEGKP